MITDLNTLDVTQPLRADLCIVGAGAAGIAVAREFLGAGARVLLLESGGAERDESADALNAGESVGNGAFDLTGSRSRLLGGTTRLWAGQCIPLDAVDFERRPWVPHSGWPISRRDLDPFYRRAEAVLGVAGETYDASLYDHFAVRPPALDERRAGHRATVYSPHPDLGRTYRGELGRAANLQVVLNATVTRLTTDGTRSRVVGAEVRTLGGRVGRVEAGAYVVAGGGVENARLLLLSDELGNAHDQVGRYLQEHPNGRVARVESDAPRVLHDTYGLLYKGRVRFFPKVFLGPDAQREYAVLNCTSAVVSDFGADSGIEAAKRLYRASVGRASVRDVGRDVARLVTDVGGTARTLYRRYRRGLSPTARTSTMWLQSFAEQAPNPSSRVTLGERRDQLGQPVARVDWRLTELDRRTAAAMAQVVAAEFARLGVARVLPDAWLTDETPGWEGKLRDMYHHIGTTRMSHSPREGVVDPDCRVHGVANLYLAGSSVFPTSGYANPTLTIVALALRLADHLKGAVGGRRAGGA